MGIVENPNDIGHVVEADREHVWHHLTQHKPFESADPRIFVEGRGMRLWDATGREYLDGVSGGVWTVNVGYGRESIADAVREQVSAWWNPPVGAKDAEDLVVEIPKYTINQVSEAH